jgi:tetratricopeptide (TPR) repeat protein
MRIPSSLCLIVRNEQAGLPICLRSVAGLCPDTVVVDTGSTDRTREIAAQFGARVFDFPWCDDFAAARNESLRHATGDWILWLDADEYLDDANRAKLADLLASLKDENAAYVMTVRCRPDTPGGEATDVTHVRLFRNRPEHRWRYRAHEQILPALLRSGAAIRFTDIVITHSGYEDPALRRRKLERNLRLLHLDHAEHPDEPFILFNLGWSYLDLGQPGEALPFLRRSLERCTPGLSIIRKLYAVLAQCQRRLGQPREALAACGAGLARCPGDPELLFLQGSVREQLGDRTGAEQCWLRLLPPHHQPLSPEGRGEQKAPHPRPLSREGRGEEDGPHPRPLSAHGGRGERVPEHFASVGSGLRGFTTRHRLALLYRAQGRDADAETQWRAALAERPDFTSAWAGLGQLALGRQSWADLEMAVAELRRHPGGAAEALVLEARGLMARRQLPEARRLLQEAAGRDPQALVPRVLLTHALLQEGDWPAAERALREVLERAPAEAESWRNLAVLLRQQGRPREAEAACRSGRAHCPGDAGLLLLHGLLLEDLGDLTTAETCLLRLLEAPAGDAAAAERAVVARHHLAQVYQAQGRAAEAELQWRAVLAERPDQAAAWLGLGQLHLAAGRWPELEAAAAGLEALPQGAAEAAVLRARGCLARRDYAAARALLESAIALSPVALTPRVLLSHALLQEDRDPEAAERALRDVLAVDPNNAEARRNLAVLLRRNGQAAAGTGDG